MSQTTFEQAVSAVRALTPDEYAKFRNFMRDQDESERKQCQANSHEDARLATLRDFSADHQWLVDNRDEYAEQWVALWHGELLGHSTDAKEVYAAADAAGHPLALVVLVEPSRDYPFINIG